MRLLIGLVMVVSAVGCGGSQKTDGGEELESGWLKEDNEEDYEPVDDTLVPPEKFEEIELTMSRRQPKVSHCFADSMMQGDLDKNARGEITVGLTITTAGKPTNVRVLQTNLKSRRFQECVVAEIEQAQFTTLPKPVDYSHTYRLERDY